MDALTENTLFIQLVVILALVIIDLAAAVGKAIQIGTFDWAKLLTFLRTNVACCVLV